MQSDVVNILEKACTQGQVVKLVALVTIKQFFKTAFFIELPPFKHGERCLNRCCFRYGTRANFFFRYEKSIMNIIFFTKFCFQIVHNVS